MKENALVKSETNLMEVQKDDNKKIFLSLDLNKEENIDKLLASQDSENVLYVKDNVGKVINCIGVYITRREFEDTDDDGEVFTRKKHATLLFDADGSIYVTGSNSFFQSLDFICTLKGWPTEEHPMKIKFSESDAEEKGHKYLKAVIVKEEQENIQ